MNQQANFLLHDEDKTILISKRDELRAAGATTLDSERRGDAVGLGSEIVRVQDYRALVLRPSVMEGDTLKLRVGLRWSADIPLAAIRRVRRLDLRQPELGDHSVNAAVLGAPRLVLELARPVQLLGMYGWRRQAESIAITVDDEERFVRTLRELCSG